MSASSKEGDPSAGWLEGREHCLPVRIYYEDTDFTGVVYHANYLRYFERGRSDFFRVIGVSHTELAAQDSAFTITRIEVDYRRAARVVAGASPIRRVRASPVEPPSLRHAPSTIGSSADGPPPAALRGR